MQVKTHDARVKVGVAPGRDEGRRVAVLGGETSQCVSVSSDLAQHCMVFSCPLCCVSFSQ